MLSMWIRSFIVGALGCALTITASAAAQAPRYQPPENGNGFAWQLLAQHNAERERKGLQRLNWSHKLAQQAQGWADRLAREGRMYHADQATLRIGFYYELAVLEETQRFFDWCYRNEYEATLLRTPDGSRPILNTKEKREGLLTISCELDDLVKAVREEQLGNLRKVIPAAA